MSTCLSDTIGGYNTFLQTSNQTDIISLYLFDYECISLYEDVLISDATFLDRKNYIPRGSTALLDSIDKIIQINEDPKTIVIITDGDENASTKNDFPKINKLIESKKELGWKFIFMGANQDAIATACRINIEEGCALTFSTEKIDVAFRSMSAAIQRSPNGEDIEFTQLERLSSKV